MGDEEDYNLYDKPLFTDRSEAAIHKIKPVKEDENPNDKMKKLLVKHPKPARGFEGAEGTNNTDKTIEFEKKEVSRVGKKEKDE